MLLSIMWQPGWEGGFVGEWIHVYVWLSSLAVETITTLLIGYTPIQNKKFKKINKKYHLLYKSV